MKTILVYALGLMFSFSIAATTNVATASVSTADYSYCGDHGDKKCCKEHKKGDKKDCCKDKKTTSNTEKKSCCKHKEEAKK